MENSEAVIIKKSVYGESDYIVTIFTKRFGKVRVLARGAKTSKKRFGGRLEPFLLLNASITFNKNKFNILNDISLQKSYGSIVDSLESFAFGTFFLEHLDIFTAEEDVNGELFDLSIQTLEQLSSGQNLLPSILKFQLVLLEVNGIRPDFESFEQDTALLDITDGNIYDKKEKVANNRYRPIALDIIKKPELMDIFLKKVNNNTKILAEYIEHYTDKKFKTSSFLNEITL